MKSSIEFGIKKEKQTDNYGRFVISPLPRGFGHTVGNALRRVLLGAMPGAAITQIKVTGANHPFAVLKGVREDLIDIIMKVKQIRIVSQQEKPVKGKIDKTGPGEVRAGEIKFPPGVKVVNPELVLAHLADKKTRFKAEFTVEKGEGYSLAEDHKTDKIGLISVDAIFSPVIKATFSVVPVRVGKKTDQDQLILEVWTDKTALPEEVVKKASMILVDVFGRIVQFEAPKVTSKKKKSTNPSLDLLIDELELPLRLVNALKRAGYKKVADFKGVRREELAGVKNVGEKSLVQLEAVLKKKGVVLED